MTPKTDTATFIYRIAEHYLRLTFAKLDINSMELLPSMKPFLIEKEDGIDQVGNLPLKKKSEKPDYSGDLVNLEKS